MSGPVIIRLQNLPMEARSIDIRRFFEGLVIPDGGVHIIGGEKGDAFIAFQSDEDARQAMARDSYPLCNSKIKLYLSSKTEMQNIISSARNPQIPILNAPKNLPMTEEVHLYKTTASPQILNQSTQSIIMSHQTQSYASASNTNQMDLLSSLTKLIGNKNPAPVAPEIPHENKNSNIYEQMKNFSSWFPNAQKPSEPVKQDPNEGIGLLKKAPQQNLPPLFTDTLTKTSPKTIVSPAESKPVTSHAFLSMPPPPIGVSHAQPQSNQTQPAAQPKISIDQILNLLQNHIPSSNQQNTASSNSSLASVIAALPSILSDSKIQPQQNNQTNQHIQPPPQLQQPPPNIQTNLPPPSLQPNQIYTMPPPNLTSNLPPTSLPPPNYSQSQYQTESKPTNNPPPSSLTNNNYTREFYNNSNSYKTAISYNSTGFNNSNNNNNSNGNNNSNNASNSSYQSVRDEEKKSNSKTNETNNGQRTGYVSNNNNSNNNNYYNNNKQEGKNIQGDSRTNRNESSFGNGQRSSSSSTTSVLTNNKISGSYQDPKSNYQRTALDPVIKVKNFNSNCSYKDVRTFLQGIQIEHDGIKLLTDHATHQRNGSAYVKLVTITDLKKALCRNGQFYMEKSIEVSQSSESDFSGATNVYIPNIIKAQQAAAANGDQQPKYINKRTETPEVKKLPELNLNDTSGFYLKIYGLPLKFDEGALKSMFNNVKFVRILTSAPTPITSTNNGTQEATTTLKAKKLCQVETQLDLERALTRQDERVGKSKLQIFQISKAEFDRELGNLSRLSAIADIGEDISDEYETDNDNCLLMTGVPFSAREADVRGFFSGLQVTSVHLIQDTQTQKPTGECYCQFASRNDRDRALERHDQLFRNRVVKIKPFSFSEFGQLMNNLGQIKQSKVAERVKSETGRPALLQTPISPGDRPRLLAGSEYDEGDYDSNSENSNGVGSRSSYKMNYQSRNSRDDGSYQNQNNRYQNNQGYQQNSTMKRRANGSSPTNISSNQTGQNKRTKSNYYNENGTSIPSLMVDSIPPILPPLPPELQKYRDRLLLLSNVSYEASREDILDLVKTYSPLEHTLKIRHDDSGQPTGDAVVACKEPLDAADAADELNGIIFMDRQISANLFSK